MEPSQIAIVQASCCAICIRCRPIASVGPSFVRPT